MDIFGYSYGARGVRVAGRIPRAPESGGGDGLAPSPPDRFDATGSDHGAAAVDTMPVPLSGTTTDPSSGSLLVIVRVPLFVPSAGGT